MADKEEWIVDGYQFGSAKDATQAKAELLKIQKLEDKMDYRNPHMVYMVYHKAIENRIFKTPIGYEYLRKLQKHLKENPLIREPVQDVPVNNVYSLRDSTNPAVEKVKASAKPKPCLLYTSCRDQNTLWRFEGWLFTQGMYGRASLYLCQRGL